MNDDTRRAESISIGLLSELTGVPVRTIRFYCDEGILQSRRTTGGHRVFGRSEAVDRLLLVRRLRALGLPLITITAVLDGSQSIADAVAAERTVVERELSDLSRRHASLLSVEHATGTEQGTRLHLLAAVQDSQAAHDAIVTFWRRVLISMPPAMFDAFVSMNIPELPADPTPDQAVAYAELFALVANAQFATIATRQLWRSDQVIIRERTGLLAGVGEAFEEAAALVLAGEPPTSGPALDRLVEAHARARQQPDTPHFRANLLSAAPIRDPDYERYWQLATAIDGEAALVGQAHHWLIASLRRSVEQDQT